MTTKAEISAWFDEAKHKGATHMLVVCDTYDYADYPVPCTGDADCLAQFKAHDGQNMQRVMECYDLRIDKEIQLAATRVMHLPTAS